MLKRICNLINRQSVRNTTLFISLFLAGLPDNLWAVNCKFCAKNFEATLVNENGLIQCPSCTVYIRPHDETATPAAAANTTDLHHDLQTLTVHSTPETGSDASGEVTTLPDTDGTALSSDTAADESRGAEGGVESDATTAVNPTRWLSDQQIREVLQSLPIEYTTEQLEREIARYGENLPDLPNLPNLPDLPDLPEDELKTKAKSAGKQLKDIANNFNENQRFATPNFSINSDSTRSPINQLIQSDSTRSPINQLIQILVQNGMLSNDLQIQIEGSISALGDNPEEQSVEDTVISLFDSKIPNRLPEIRKLLSLIKSKARLRRALQNATEQLPAITLQDTPQDQNITTHHITLIQNALDQLTHPATEITDPHRLIPEIINTQGQALNLLTHQIITRDNLNLLVTELSQGKRVIMIIEAFDITLMIAISPALNDLPSINDLVLMSHFA
ncbi:MAG: hypothetical protein ACPG5T_01875, partial [Endozoicomonas sp.]